jgi:SulP family sulfate permease
MAIILVSLSGIVSYVAMPALGALLIYASAKTISLDDIRAIWAAGWPSIIAAAATFTSMLFLPIQVSVAIGAALSTILYAYESSNEIVIVQLVKRDDGFIEERRPPQFLTSNQVTVFDVYGNLFYAGARTLARLLPQPNGAENSVVVLRLRGRKRIGATLVEVLSAYAETLNDAGGRLYLSGVSDHAYDLLNKSVKLRLSTPVTVLGATPVLGESTDRAYASGTAWLVEQGDSNPT